MTMNNTQKLIIFILIVVVTGLLLSAVCGLSTLGISLMRPRTPGAAFSQTLKGSFSDIDIDSKTADIRITVTSEKNGKVAWSGSRLTKLSVKTRNGSSVRSSPLRIA